MRNYCLILFLFIFQLISIIACSEASTGSAAAAAPAGSSTAPTVTFTTPFDDTINVPTNYTTVTATFSDTMDASTINTTTFMLMDAEEVIPSTVSLLGNIATLKTTSNLTPHVIYTVLITTGAKNTSGAALAANKIWNFMTGAGEDTEPPLVISTLPQLGAINTAISGTIIAVTFNEVMDPSTVNATTFTLMRGTIPIPGTVTYLGKVATFRANANLDTSTTYTATITTGVKESAGNSLAANYTWTFTTRSATAVVDVAPPTVLSVNPVNGRIDVPRNMTIVSTFSEKMDPVSFLITTASSIVPEGGTAIGATVTWDLAGNVVSFTPTSTLSPNTKYTATITTAAKDVAGNGLAANYVWTFTTGADLAQVISQSTISLGRVSSFATLAGSSITHLTNTALITGNVGVVTGAGSAIGTTCAELSGAGATNFIYANDTTATGGTCVRQDSTTLNNAQSDAILAFQDGSGRSGSPQLLANELNGVRLYPGLYVVSGVLTLADNGFLYLDAVNDPNAVFIIKVPSAGGGMTTGAGSTVILLGGAKASNVFWVVGTQASLTPITLGANSFMKGTLMSSAGAITLGAGSNLQGRALTQTNGGTITINSNAVVTIPAP